MKKFTFPIVVAVVILTIGAASTTVSYFKDINATAVVSTKAFQSYHGTLTHAGTVTLNFDATTTVNAMTITGNVTFSTSNLATNRTYRLKITGASTNCVPTFPAWVFMTGAPSIIAASKISFLTLESWGANDTNVMAWFQEQP